MKALLLFLPLIACGDKDDSSVDDTSADDTGATDDTSADDTSADDTGQEQTGHSFAVVTSVSSDYSVGSISLVSLDDWSVTDDLFVTSSDAAVSFTDGALYQINRYGFDTARRYTPGEWTEPVWEKELADLSNPGDAAVCGDSLFIALYGTSSVGVYDPATGNLTGSVDLSAFDDSDAIGPEPGSLVVADGKVYVGLNRLNRDNFWGDEGGAVVEVDCGTKAVSNSWSVGGNTSVSAWPGTDKVLVLARAFGDDVGGLYGLDPATGGLDHILSVEGEEFSGVAANGDAAMLISLASDYSHYALHCADLSSGVVNSSTPTAEYYGGIQGNDRGEAWVLSSPSWIDETAATGLSVYDIATCGKLTTDNIELGLFPKDLTFY